MFPHGLGCIKGEADSRDFDLPEKITKSQELPPVHMIPSTSFTPIKDQGIIGSCTAFAAVAQMEYYIKQKTGDDVDLSEMFLYLETRRELGWEREDSGAYLRTVMKALVSVGVCEERLWPYDEAKFTKDPPAHIYPRADDFSATKYYKVDKEGYDKNTVMARLKSALLANLPCTMGFTCYDSALSQAKDNGAIPLPSYDDVQTGGHAVLIIGYDDDFEIKNNDDNTTTKGAFIIRNSWGDDWGRQGYGYIPYEYFSHDLMWDIWCMYAAKYLDTEQFE